jgi:hypothetical protein
MYSVFQVPISNWASDQLRHVLPAHQRSRFGNVGTQPSTMQLRGADHVGAFLVPGFVKLVHDPWPGPLSAFKRLPLAKVWNAAGAVGQALPCSDRCLANSSHSAVELNRERRPSSSCSVLLKFRPGRSVDGTGNTRSKAQVRVC